MIKIKKDNKILSSKEKIKALSFAPKNQIFCFIDNIEAKDMYFYDEEGDQAY